KVDVREDTEVSPTSAEVGTGVSRDQTIESKVRARRNILDHPGNLELLSLLILDGLAYGRRNIAKVFGGGLFGQHQRERVVESCRRVAVQHRESEHLKHRRVGEVELFLIELFFVVLVGRWKASPADRPV